MYAEQEIHSPLSVTSIESIIQYPRIPVTQIRRALQEKYQKQFNIFRKIPINFLMYNCKKARLTQQYKDAICESSDREYMRRMYYDCASKMSTGVSESIQRIRYLTRCLSSENEIKMKISYEYPTMYLTGTYKIFITRLKRLKYQKAISFSSQLSFSISKNCSFSQSNQPKYKIYDFLIESNQSSQQSLSQFIFRFPRKSSISYQQSIADIYNHQCSQTVSYVIDFKQKQDDLAELICDFQQNREELPKIISNKQNGPLSNSDISSIAPKMPRNRFISNQQEYRLAKIHQNFKKQAFKEVAQQPEQFERENGNKFKKKKNQQISLKSMRKRRVQEKAHQLLQKIKNEQSFQFQNKKFYNMK